MIAEDYCSFEVAKLLKEKGFNEKCSRWYVANEPQEGLVVSGFGENQFYINAPTHQMAMKWLRGKGIYITIVYGDYPSLNKVFWTPQIDSLEGFNLPDSFYEEYDKYEEAVEAALKYSLENLI